MSLLYFFGGEITRKKNREHQPKISKNCFRADFDFPCVSVEASAFIGFAY